MIVFQYPLYGVARQTFLYTKMGKSLRIPIPFVQPVGCAEPESACAILVAAQNFVIAQAAGIFDHSFVMDKRTFRRIKTVQAAGIGSDPQHTLGIFANCPDKVITQAFGIIVIMHVTDELFFFIIEST